MSYLVLARRWRPSRFEELIGQPHVAKTLLNSIRKGRIAHAYLFTGPRGVGKTSAARLVARALNCLAPENGEPCGKCQSCTSITQGRFIDSIEIDAASNTSVDDIRKLREGIRYAPIEGKVKIYVIDEVHMLSTSAFNALLKTLEEPPEHAYFCLATTEPQKVPATIISRCQRFDFRRVSSAELRDHLQRICESDKIEYDLDALDIIARRADGSVRDSLSLLDQVIAFADGKALKDDTIDIVGEIKLDQYHRALALVTSGDAKDAFRLDEYLSFHGTDPQDYLGGLQGYLIQMLQGKALGVDRVDIPAEALERFSELSKRLSDGDLIRLLALATAAEADIRRNFNARVRLQLLLLRFATFERSVVLQYIIDQVSSGKAVKSTAKPKASAEKKNRITATTKTEAAPPPETVKAPEPEPEPVAESKPELVPEPVTEPKPAPKVEPKLEQEPEKVQEPEAKSPVDLPEVPQISSDDVLTDVQNAWEKICSVVAKEHNSEGNLLKYSGRPVRFEEGKLTIHLGTSSLLRTAQSCQAELKQAIQTIAGDIQIEYLVAQVNGVQKEQQVDDPVIQLLKDRLGASPING